MKAAIKIHKTKPKSNSSDFKTVIGKYGQLIQETEIIFEKICRGRGGIRNNTLSI